MKQPWTFGMAVRLVIAIPFIIVFCFAEAFAEIILGGRGQVVERWTLDPIQRIVCWDPPFFTDHPVNPRLLPHGQSPDC